MSEDLARRVYMEAMKIGAHNDCLVNSKGACEGCKAIVFVILDKIVSQIIRDNALLRAVGIPEQS